MNASSSRWCCRRQVRLVGGGRGGCPVEAQRDGFSARDAMVLPPVVQQPHPPFWIHGNSRVGPRAGGDDRPGLVGTPTGDDEVLARSMRTAPLPDLAALRVRIAEVRAATERAGRDPADVDIVVSGLWPMLDARPGWSAEQRLEEAATLTELGVGWMVLTSCGDDAGAAVETVRRFGQEVVCG